MQRGHAWPTPFPAAELKGTAPVDDWKRAFGARGKPERFYPHMVDFAKADKADLTAPSPVPSLLPRWGRPQTSWPLVYVSAHGYGVAQAADVPPFYYWARFAQKSTNAALSGIQGPLGYGPIGPRGPALRGWDTTSLFEKRLAAAGVQVRTGVAVTSVARMSAGVTVTTADGSSVEYDKMVLASDLKGSLAFLDADANERELFGKIRHQP